MMSFPLVESYSKTRKSLLPDAVASVSSSELQLLVLLTAEVVPLTKTGCGGGIFATAGEWFRVITC